MLQSEFCRRFTVQILELIVSGCKVQLRLYQSVPRLMRNIRCGAGERGLVWPKLPYGLNGEIWYRTKVGIAMFCLHCQRQHASQYQLQVERCTYVLFEGFLEAFSWLL